MWAMSHSPYRFGQAHSGVNKFKMIQKLLERWKSDSVKLIFYWFIKVLYRSQWEPNTVRDSKNNLSIPGFARYTSFDHWPLYTSPSFVFHSRQRPKSGRRQNWHCEHVSPSSSRPFCSKSSLSRPICRLLLYCCRQSSRQKRRTHHSCTQSEHDKCSYLLHLG